MKFILPNILKPLRKYSQLLSIIQNYLSDCQKNYLKRYEVSRIRDAPLKRNGAINNPTYYGVNLLLVGKPYLLHDRLDCNEDEPHRVMLRKMDTGDTYRLGSTIFSSDTLRGIKSSILSLTDTRHVLLMGSAAHERLSSRLTSDTVVDCGWFQTTLRSDESKSGNHATMLRLCGLGLCTTLGYGPQNPDIFHQIDRNDNSDKDVSDDLCRFEEGLLRAIACITSTPNPGEQIQMKFSSSTRLQPPVSNEVSFSILKVGDICLAVLLPRLANIETTLATGAGGTRALGLSGSECLVNIWPILPVAAVHNETRFIEGLKVGSKAKHALQSLAVGHITARHYSLNGELQSSPYATIYKVFHLRHELMKGITFPQILHNRISLNQIYMAYFLEFMVEHVHFQFASPLSDCGSYVRCMHCDTIFDSIFGFVRHWWEVRERGIFRCHLCDMRLISLRTLGLHYTDGHPSMSGDNAAAYEGQIILRPSVQLSGTRPMVGVGIGPRLMEKRVSSGINFLEEYVPHKKNRPTTGAATTGGGIVPLRTNEINNLFMKTRFDPIGGGDNEAFLSRQAIKPWPVHPLIMEKNANKYYPHRSHSNHCPKQSSLSPVQFETDHETHITAYTNVPIDSNCNSQQDPTLLVNSIKTEIMSLNPSSPVMLHTKFTKSVSKYQIRKPNLARQFFHEAMKNCNFLKRHRSAFETRNYGAKRILL